MREAEAVSMSASELLNFRPNTKASQNRDPQNTNRPQNRDRQSLSPPGTGIANDLQSLNSTDAASRKAESRQRWNSRAQVLAADFAAQLGPLGSSRFRLRVLGYTDWGLGSGIVVWGFGTLAQTVYVYVSSTSQSRHNIAG